MGKDRNMDQKQVVYLGLGSNLGERVTNIESAIQALAPEVEITKVSSLYQTKPWGFLDQPDFLNLVLEGIAILSPFDLLVYLKEIENEIGRKPNFRYGPRLVDIDILLYGDDFIDENRLTIPHKHMKERTFVLVPMAEIAPDLKYPGTEETISDLAGKVDSSGVILYQENND